VTGAEKERRGRPDATDPGDFLDVFWRHGPAVHAYLARRTSRQNADDLLGEVWLRALRSQANYDRRFPDALPWLYGIARNVLRAHWRSVEPSGANNVDTFSSDPWPDTDRKLDAGALRDTLRHLLDALSDDEREVLLLVTWEQLTPAEAAVALDIPQGTARSRLHRALSVLRSEIDVDPEGPAHAYGKEN
jgi:RNA polymerase sigma factor (sigma-70 family)